MDLPNPLHPTLQRAFDIIEPMFVDQVLPESGHGLLSSLSKAEDLLDQLPETASSVKTSLLRKWSRDTSSPTEMWSDIKSYLSVFLDSSGKKGTSKSAKSMSTKERSRLENWPVEIVFRYGYPRLDINVSKMRNHLLKSPFCVHPSTGRVCVPIRKDDIDMFDPFAVPTLPQLERELVSIKSGGEEESHSPAWKKTSLRGYFEPFQKEFLEPLKREYVRVDRFKAEQQAARTGDF